MGLFRWIFRRGKKEEVQQPVKGKTVSKGGRLTADLVSNLAVISNHLTEWGDKAKDASKQEGVPNIRRNLYKAKRNVQIAIGKLNK